MWLSLEMHYVNFKRWVLVIIYMIEKKKAKQWCRVTCSLAQRLWVDDWIYMQVRKQDGFWVPGEDTGVPWEGGQCSEVSLEQVCECLRNLSFFPSYCAILSKPCLPGLVQLQFSVGATQHRNRKDHMAASKGSFSRLNKNGKTYNCLHGDYSDTNLPGDPIRLCMSTL